MKGESLNKLMVLPILVFFVLFFFSFSGPYLAGDLEASAPASAQEDQEKKESGEMEEEKKEEIRKWEKVEMVVVTATRGEMDFFDVPATASVITSDDIERQNPQNITELLNSIPGVEVSGTGAAGSFRGIPSIRGWSSNRVLILVDGQRLNTTRESTDFGGIIPALVDVNEVERVEVIKGAGAVLYGSDALGGVINIITKKSDEKSPPLKIEYDLRYSTADEQAGARVGLSGTAGLFSYRLGYSAYDAKNYGIPGTFLLRENFRKAGVEEAKPLDYVPGSQSRGKNADFSGMLRVSENHRIVLDYFYRRTRDAEFPISLENQEFINYNPSIPVIPFACNAGGCGLYLSFPVYDWDRINLGYQGANLGLFAKLEANLYYQKIDKESLTGFDFLIMPPPFPGADPISFPLNLLTVSDIQTTGANVKLDSVITSNNLLTYGLDYYEDQLDETHFTDGVRDVQSVPDSSSSNMAFYIQDSSQLLSNRNLLLVAALRYDRNTFKSEDDPYYEGDTFDVTEKDLTWNLSGTYHFTSNVNGYVNIGRSFRAPNLQERAVAGEVSVGGYFIQNPDLSAETNTNFEIGAKTQFERFGGEAALYYSRIRDLITAVDLDDPATPFTEVMLQNINRVKGFGGELSIHYLPLESLDLSLSYSYQKREDQESGQRIPGDHPQKVTLSARWEPPRSKYYIEWLSKFVNRMNEIDDPAFGQQTVPGYGIHSLRAGYTFHRSLTATLTINNLFDKQYFEALAPNWWAPERNFILGLRGTFL